MTRKRLLFPLANGSEMLLSLNSGTLLPAALVLRIPEIRSKDYQYV